MQILVITVVLLATAASHITGPAAAGYTEDEYDYR